MNKSIINKISISFLALLFFGLIAVAQNQKEKETPPPGGTPKDFKIPDREIIKLDNGLRLVLVEYGIIPKVSVQLKVNVGNIDEKENEVWLADLLADLMKEGTTTMDGKALSTAVAKMGGELNLGVGTHQTFATASVLSDFAPDLIKLLGDVMQNPAIPADEIERLKKDIKRSVSVSKTRAQTMANEKFNSILFKDHPYGRPMPSDEMIDTYTVDKIKAFYDQHFGAQRTTIYVVGKFNRKAVIESVKSTFKDWKKGTPQEIKVATPNKSNEIALVDRADSPQSTIIFGTPVVDPSHPDYTALDVMNDLLGGSFSSRITSNIREDKGYTYSPRSAVSNRYKTAVWTQKADLTIAETGNALKEIVFEIDRLNKEAPTKEELEAIQNYKAGIFVLQNSSPDGIIGQLSFIDMHGLDESYLNERIKEIYSITPDQVSEISKKYLDWENMTLVVVGDKKITVPQIEAFKKAEKGYIKIQD